MDKFKVWISKKKKKSKAIIQQKNEDYNIE